MKLKRWFDSERECNTEVRHHHIVQQLLFELQYELDAQCVFEETSHERLNKLVKAFCLKKLGFLQVTGGPCKRQERVVERVVKVYIGATGQHKKGMLGFTASRASTEPRGLWV